MKYSFLLDFNSCTYDIDRLVQEGRNFIANALELRLFALAHRYGHVIVMCNSIITMLQTHVCTESLLFPSSTCSPFN